MAKVKTLSVEVGKGTQSLELQELLTLGDYKLRILIKVDSVDRQSHAVIYVFSAADCEWKALTSIHFSNMKTQPRFTQNHKDPAAAKGFQADRDQLVKLAIALLG